MKSKCLIYSLILSSGNTLFGQQTLAAGGGDGVSSAGKVSFTIGQVSYMSVSGNNGSASEGVQQALEIFTLGVADFSATVTLSVFPNPAADYLMLQWWASEKTEKLRYKIHDVSGKLISEQPLQEEKTLIDLLAYANGTYFLEVFSTEKSIQTFKIIKNN